MIAEHRTLERRTRGNEHIVDLTGELQDLVAATGVTTGQDTRPRNRVIHVSVVGV